MTTSLVTGGAGAIGSHLVRALLDLGHEVAVLDDLSSGRRELVPDEVRLIVGSVTEEDALADAFDPPPDLVAHLAALFANQNSVEHPELDLDVNGRGTLRVFDRARRSRAAKVLYCSSSSASTLVTPYALTKRLGEGYARFWAAEHALDVVTVRPSNSYGPHEYPGPYRNVIPNFLAAALRGESLVVTGTGEETRDFTFVGDIVAGMVGALLKPTPAGSTYELGTGRATSIGDLASRINQLTGNAASVLYAPRRTWDEVTHREIDITAARDAFGYEPKISLDEGLGITLKWLRAANA